MCNNTRMSKKKTPAEQIEETRKILQLTKTKLASKLGIAPNTLYAVLNNKRRIDPNLASKLGELHKDTAYWLTLQHEHDLSVAK